MKQKSSSPVRIPCLLGIIFLLFVFDSCNTHSSSPAYTRLEGYDKDAMNSILVAADNLQTFPFVTERVKAIKESLINPLPVMLCQDSLNSDQKLAQLIALSDASFTQYVRHPETKLPYRNEVFGIYPARQSDIATVPGSYILSDLYRVEMYNYGLNLASYAIVHMRLQKVLFSAHQPQSQPDIPSFLQKLAVQIAAASKEVQQALGITPSEKEALMSSTKTALNRTRCERSHHLCIDIFLGNQ